MNELEPDAQQQWLWFGAALLAMTIIAFVVTVASRLSRSRTIFRRVS
jgi:hypothetical protein